MKAYERLIAYTKYEAASDSKSETCPSTVEQLDFGRALVQDMLDLGIEDANMDENGYVFGTIPANIEGWDGTVIGFIAHMDVVRDVPFQGVKTRIVRDYDGGEIVLNAEKNIILSPREYDSFRTILARIWWSPMEPPSLGPMSRRDHGNPHMAQVWGPSDQAWHKSRSGLPR